MHTTNELARAVMRQQKITSAYALAKKFDVSSQSVDRWLHKNSAFSDESAIKCAQLLSLPALYTVACARYERAKNEECKNFWKKVAEAPEEPSTKEYAA